MTFILSEERQVIGSNSRRALNRVKFRRPYFPEVPAPTLREQSPPRLSRLFPVDLAIHE